MISNSHDTGSLIADYLDVKISQLALSCASKSNFCLVTGTDRLSFAKNAHQLHTLLREKLYNNMVAAVVNQNMTINQSVYTHLIFPTELDQRQKFRKCFDQLRLLPKLSCNGGRIIQNNMVVFYHCC